MRGARLAAVVLLLTLCACDRDAVRVDGQAVAAAVPRRAEAPGGPGLSRAGAAPASGRGLGSGKPITFAFGGDVNFEGTPRTLLTEDPAALFAGVTDALQADVTMVNLETAITERGRAEPKEFNFRAPASAFAALRTAGVDVVTLANNHGLDFGQEGLLDTLDAADDLATGLPLIGAGHDTIEAYSAFRVTLRGQRISILGASRVIDGDLIDGWTVTDDRPGIAVAEDPTRLLEAVRAERAHADTLVVYLHWGRERVNCPIDDQPEMADALIAAGADVVVGSHAHVPLGGGLRNGAYVHYGLGNFLFGSAGGPSAESGVLRLTLTGRRVDAAEWVPVHLRAGVPETLTGSAAERAHAAWEDLRPCAQLEPGTERTGAAGGAGEETDG
ncbi:MAG TPA: CapA family protein [Acidimicrobiales bacterium]